MRGNLIPSLTQVQLHHSGCVDGKSLVGINHNTKQSRVGVDELGLIASLQVPIDRGIIEKGQVCHVFTLLKFGWIDLSQFFRLVSPFLKGKKKDNVRMKIYTYDIKKI